MNDIDIFAEDNGAKVGDNVLASIRATVLDLKEADAEVARLQDQLDAAKKRRDKIAQNDLPTLMESADQLEITTLDGYKVTIKETIRASIPAAQQPRAFAWLIENGHEKLIQRTFTFKFGNNQADLAQAFEDTVTKLEQLPEYDDKRRVHSASLSSFVKAELEAGREVPLDLLGVFRQREAVVKDPK